MNQQIQELSTQARAYAQRYVNEAVIPYGKTASEFQRIFESKFSELLIQEAIKVVQRRYMGDNNREDMEVRRCVADLKKSFGVE
jgi:hypothetical protein